MIIAIDGRPLVNRATGIATFLRCFIDSSADIYPDYIFYILLPHELDDSIVFKERKNIKFILSPFPKGLYSFQILWYLFKVPYVIRKLHPDFFFTALPQLPLFMPYSVKSIVTVHDVVNIEYKKTMSWKNKFVNKLLFGKSICHADYIWCNSTYTRKKIDEYYPVRKQKKCFVGASVDSTCYKKIKLTDSQIQNIKNKYFIDSQFILFVGNIEPRKNLQFLLKLMPYLYEKYNIKLLVVGANGWKNSYLYKLVEMSPQIKTSTVFAGYVSNNELSQLYNVADCFVSTSLNEGFGMPQLEAMMCGCPVVSPYNSAMIEIVGGRGTLIKGWNKNVWINEIINNIGHRKVVELSPFNWTRICHDFFENYLLN